MNRQDKLFITLLVILGFTISVWFAGWIAATVASVPLRWLCYVLYLGVVWGVTALISYKFFEATDHEH